MVTPGHYDEDDMVEIRETCPVFRILIVGKANAGKTTILRKVCNVDENTKPIIYDEQGHIIEDIEEPDMKQDLKPDPKPDSKPDSKPDVKPDVPKSLRNKAKDFLGKVKQGIRSASPGCSKEPRKETYTREQNPSKDTDIPKPSSQSTEPDTETNVRGRNPFKDADILKPSTERGQHEITHQITYPGSRFIFHDSRGIEAGGIDELQIIHDFLSDRESRTVLAERLHAIWFCVPMDDKRPFSPSELAFFEKATGRVPVVLVFTKYDGMLHTVRVDLYYGIGPDITSAQISEEAEKRYQEHYYGRVMNTAYPPKAVVRLRDMNKPTTKCSELSEVTASAIDDESLQRVFVSVQQNNLELCMKKATGASMDLGLDVSANNMTREIWRWFPHAWYTIQWNEPDKWQEETSQKGHWHLSHLSHLSMEFAKYFLSLLPATSTWEDVVVKAQLKTAAIVVATHSFTKWRKVHDEWKESVQLYKNAHTVQAYIQEEIKLKFNSEASKEDQADLIIEVTKEAVKLLGEKV